MKNLKNMIIIILISIFSIISPISIVYCNDFSENIVDNTKVSSDVPYMPLGIPMYDQNPTIYRKNVRNRLLKSAFRDIAKVIHKISTSILHSTTTFQ